MFQGQQQFVTYMTLEAMYAVRTVYAGCEGGGGCGENASESFHLLFQL